MALRIVEEIEEAVHELRDDLDRAAEGGFDVLTRYVGRHAGDASGSGNAK